MSGFDDLYREFAEIPLGVSSAFMVQIHRPMGPPPIPLMTKTARAGLLKLAMVKRAQGEEGLIDVLQNQAMVDPAIQQALDYEQAKAERDNYEQQLAMMSDQMQQAEQRAALAEQTSTQLQQAQMDTNQQLAMAQEQANVEAVGKQQAVQQAIMAKDENLQSQMIAAQNREQVVAMADQLQQQVEQFKQVAAQDPLQQVREQQMMQQQQMAQPDPTQPAEVQKEQKEAINAQQDAAVQGQQAQNTQVQEAQKQQVQQAQQQGGGMVAQSAHGMGKVDIMRAKLASLTKCSKCGGMVKKGMTKCSGCGCMMKTASGGRVSSFTTPKIQEGGGADKIKAALTKVVKEKQKFGDTPIDEFLDGKVKTALGWKGTALMTGAGALGGAGIGAVQGANQLDSPGQIGRKALIGAGIGGAAGLGTAGVVKGIGALRREAGKAVTGAGEAAAKAPAAANLAETVVRSPSATRMSQAVPPGAFPSAPTGGGIDPMDNFSLRGRAQRAWEYLNRPVQFQSPIKVSADRMNGRLLEVLEARRRG